MKFMNQWTGSVLAAAALALAPAAFGQAVTVATDGVATTTTSSIGTISDFSPDTLVIRSETSPEPLRYSYTKSTTYVDEAGAPVSIETVRSGLPVTVHYVREGDRLIANRVIVRRRHTVAEPAVVEKTVRTPAVVEERRTTQTPIVEEHKTTTTTTTTK